MDLTKFKTNMADSGHYKWTHNDSNFKHEEWQYY